MVALTIDGAAVEAPAGATILDACRAAGADMPTLCFLETLTPVNACRVCVVEVEGARVLAPACSRKIEPGMVDSHALAARGPLAQAGPGTARLVRGPVHGAVARADDARIRCRPVALRRGAGDRGSADADRQRPLHARLLEVRALLQMRRGLRHRRAAHVRDCRGGPRVRRAHLYGVRRGAAGLGLRLLRQLHRGVPDRRADGERTSTSCGRRGSGGRRSSR